MSLEQRAHNVYLLSFVSSCCAELMHPTRNMGSEIFTDQIGSDQYVQYNSANDVNMLLRVRKKRESRNATTTVAMGYTYRSSTSLWYIA